jgi:hypothetical protein
MTIPRFDPRELKVIQEIPSAFPDFPSAPMYDFPVPPKEAYKALLRRHPIWTLTGVESIFFTPSVYPDNVARGFVIEAVPPDRSTYGGKDIFGIEWVYVEQVGGSIVRPGNPFLSSANEWKEKLVWPDIDNWDWEGSARLNESLINGDQILSCWIMNGYFERLISFMDFEGAAVAMIDEEQQDAVKELFEALTDLYIRIVDKYIAHFKAEAFYVHDDWGSQMAPFFSPAVTKELIVPAMRRLTDHIHTRGALVEFHSCGHIEQQVPNMIAAGWDSWSGMAMNDTQGLYEKYGDQIIIGVMPDQFEPGADEETQRKMARDFVNHFCNPQKPCIVNWNASAILTPAYREELYKQSRIRFAECE